MSLAKINEVAKARKKPGQCEKCKVDLNVGDPYLWYTVGFRSNFKHIRCTKTACYPKPSERESSLVSGIYAAQEEFDVSGADNVEDIEADIEAVVDAINEVAEQYRDAGTNDAGVEWRPDMIERADELEEAASELEGWEPETDYEPCDEHPDVTADQVGNEDWPDDMEPCDACKANWETWIEEVRTSATDAVNNIEGV